MLQSMGLQRVIHDLEPKQQPQRLTKKVKDLCAENYKTLIKEIKNYFKNGKKPHALGLEKLPLSNHTAQSNIKI